MKRGCAWLVGAALAVAGLSAGRTAEAGANISISGPVVSSITDANRQQTRYSINYDDCMGNAQFEFPLAVKNAIGVSSLQVWVSESSDCTQASDRNVNDMTKDCRPVKDLALKSGKYTLTAKEIATAVRYVQPDCTDQATATKQHKIKLYFLLIPTSGDGNVPADNVETWTQTIVDLVAPAPPTDVTLGIGEGQLTVNYTASSDGEKKGYYFFCDPVPEGVSLTTSTTTGAGGSGGTAPFFFGVGGAGGAGGMSGVGGMGGTMAGTGGAMGTGGASGTGGGGAGGAGGASGTGGTGGTGGSGGSGTVVNCPSTVLVPGELPPSAYLCGESQDPFSTRKVLESLQNGQTYTIGVATYDLVRNVGPLSQVVCDSPVPVTDFWESYCSEGGAACVECGVCTVGAAPYAGSAWLSLGGGGLAALGLLVRRRRRDRKHGAARQGSEGV